MSTADRVAPRAPPLPLPQLAGLLLGAGVLGAAAARAPWAAAVLAALGALAAAALLAPELATLVVVFCLWLDVPAIAVDRFGAPQLAGALIPFVLVVPLLAARRHGRRLVAPPAFAAIVALLVVELASTAFATHQDEAVERVRQFALEGPIVYLLVVNAVRTPETLRRVLWALVAAGALLALVSVHQQLTGRYERPYFGLGTVDGSFFRGQSDVARLAGPLGDPNYYAQILLAVVPLALLAALRERTAWLRLAGAGAAALCCTAIAYTYSRGAAVALLAVLLAMALLGYVRTRHLAAIAVGLAVLLAAVPAYRERVESITRVGGATAEAGADADADQSTRGRTTEMRAAALAFLDHPALGVGPGGFPSYYQRYASRVGGEVHESRRSGPHAGEVPERAAHNIVLGVAADLGVAGLAAVGAVLGLTFRDLGRARRRWRGRRPELVTLADALLLALVGYLVAGLFLSLAFERYLWLLAALAGAAGGPALSAAAARTNAASRSS
jgi:O-antigen ligase